jgi:ubiquinone/menaquinone biosynthesis C-methylase UbiE
VSVASHLVIDLDEYDARIRTFIPDYEEMLDVVAHVAGLRRPRRVIDLGTGTGALAGRVVNAVRGASIVGIDADEGMLRMAARRLSRRRARFVCESFLTAPFPPCDAITASFALHHVARPRQKRELFARARRALTTGGVLISADCHPPANTWLADDGRRRWLDHLRASYGSKRAEGFLQAWSTEDFYTSLDVEERLLRAAGFTTSVVWRRNWFAVIVAQKATSRRR